MSFPRGNTHSSRRVPGSGPAPSAANAPHTSVFTHYPSPVSSASSGSRRGPTAEIAGPYPAHFHSQHIPVPSPPNAQGHSLQPAVISSARYPSLHFLLARDSAHANRFVVDMSKRPHEAVPEDVYRDYGMLWVMRSRPLHVRIVSRDFPWVIDIKAEEDTPEDDRGVTCGDVWRKLHLALLEPLQDADWAHLTDMTNAHNQIARQRVEYLSNLAEQQFERGESVTLLRLDWLMTKTLFVGLERDNEYRLSQCLILPGKDRCDETWVAEFKERE
ncbi:hypothetical protein M0805_009431 [Coniferiporia weirii]|nr:hypothetical protein M0805_009431 [Coniferiporia weirii]